METKEKDKFMVLPFSEVVTIMDLKKRWKSAAIVQFEIESESLELFTIESFADEEKKEVVIVSYRSYVASLGVPTFYADRETGDHFVHYVSVGSFCVLLKEVEEIEAVHPEYVTGGVSARKSLLSRIEELERENEALRGGGCADDELKGKALSSWCALVNILLYGDKKTIDDLRGFFNGGKLSEEEGRNIFGEGLFKRDDTPVKLSVGTIRNMRDKYKGAIHRPGE